LGPRYVGAVLPVLVAGWYVNSTVFDWYQVRRFTGLVPLLAPGVALALAPLGRAGPLLPGLFAFLTLRYDLAVDQLRPQPGTAVPVRSAAAEVADAMVRDGYRLIEPHSPGAAVALLASYTGEELLSGPMSRVDLARQTPLLRFPRPARHLSGPSVEDGAACRWVEDQDARLFLPLSWDGAVVLTIRARALETRRPQSLELEWNGRRVGRREMTPAWADYRFDVPGDAVRLGTNEVALVFEQAPIYRRVRGQGPRRVRPAAIASLVLHRHE